MTMSWLELPDRSSDSTCIDEVRETRGAVFRASSLAPSQLRQGERWETTVSSP
jgi:hypothetical protein